MSMKSRQLLTLILAPLQFAAAAFHPLTGIGRSVGDMANDAPSAATPSGYAFSIWMVIFTLSTIYAIHQARSSQTNNPLYRAIGWPLAAAMGLGSLWMLYAQLYGNGLVLLGLILLMWGSVTASLLLATRHHNAQLTTTRHGKYIISPLLGMFSGWLTLAMFLNIGSGLQTAFGVPDMSMPTASLATLIGAGLVGFAILHRVFSSSYAALAYGLTLVWGLTAVTLANTYGAPTQSFMASFHVGLLAISLAAALVSILSRLK